VSAAFHYWDLISARSRQWKAALPHTPHSRTRLTSASIQSPRYQAERTPGKRSLRIRCGIICSTPSQGGWEQQMAVKAKRDVLNRVASIEGHIRGIRKMIEEDQYCVDVLKQTYAVERAIHKLEAVLVEGHLQSCVPEGFEAGRSDDMIRELTELYTLARR
jgi:CsoR family transcriptional regulator, copper-sensing transcriptional repressor